MHSPFCDMPKITATSKFWTLCFCGSDPTTHCPNLEDPEADSFSSHFQPNNAPDIFRSLWFVWLVGSRSMIQILSASAAAFTPTPPPNPESKSLTFRVTRAQVTQFHNQRMVAGVFGAGVNSRFWPNLWISPKTSNSMAEQVPAALNQNNLDLDFSCFFGTWTQMQG